MKSNGKSIKQKPTGKLLGITFDCNLTWNDQINIITKSTNGVLRLLKSFKRFTAFTTRKYLAESLVLNEFIIAMLFMVIYIIILLNNYSEFRTVLQDMFLAVMLMLLMSLI